MVAEVAVVTFATMTPHSAVPSLSEPCLFITFTWKQEEEQNMK